MRGDFQNILDEIKAGHKEGSNIKELFHKTSDEFWFWAHTEGYRNNQWLREILPGLPDEQLQSNIRGRAATGRSKRHLPSILFLKRMPLIFRALCKTACSTLVAAGAGYSGFG
ncbi:MAG: hypothetical protein HZB85_01370 [Deltaproteobacteria bacterium]|nr:hypothetical protein [Deltaproteobacteria bacterium]